MAEPSFDRGAFESRLATLRLGRNPKAFATVGSTNDVAWEAWGAGDAHGTVIVADAQIRGRGRAGRGWITAPGQGLALSLLLTEGCDRRPLAVLPLAAGLAVAQALERLGAAPALKWPNDVLLDGRKVAGILCESRGTGAEGRGAVVIGAGINVSQRAGDFPAALAAAAPPPGSLAMAGVAASREAVAAEFLNALEPLWDRLASDGAAPLLDAWQRRAAFHGRRVRVATPAGVVEGIARGLDRDGALLLEQDGGAIATVRAGDLEAADPSPAAARGASGDDAPGRAPR